VISGKQKRITEQADTLPQSIGKGKTPVKNAPKDGG